MDPSNIPDFWHNIANLGGIGILAAGTIWLLNKTWKDHSIVIREYHEMERGRTDMLVKVVMDNTSATTKNNTVLDALHRRLDKEEYEKTQNN